MKKGSKAASTAPVPGEFRREAEQTFRVARARQCKEDIARVRELLKRADADDHWLGYLFRIYSMTADEGVPLLVELLDQREHGREVAEEAKAEQADYDEIGRQRYKR